MLFARAIRDTIGSAWIRPREWLSIASFLVTVTHMDRVRRTSMLLAYRMLDLWKANGSLWTAIYLSEASRLVTQWLAGTPETSAPRGAVGPLVQRDSKGLPTIIPRYLRTLIGERDIKVCRLVLSLLMLHRVIQCPLQLKLHTITTPGPAEDSGLRSAVTVCLARYFTRWYGKVSLGFTWLFSGSAGPNSSQSMSGIHKDAAAFWLDAETRKAFCDLAPLYVSLYMITIGLLVQIFGRLIGRIQRVCPGDPEWTEGFIPCWPWFGNAFKTAIGLRPLSLGRLSIKAEAKGKARVFAITDWWTQSLLARLSSSVFEILKTIKNDGTFDQLAPLEPLLDRIRLGVMVHSYDLSAATDRFPVYLQVEVVSWLTGSRLIGESWRVLITARGWLDPGWKTLLRYAVGQPIGARSSWAVFSLTHHVLVQVCAMRVGWTEWFPFYGLLGDDIVIADPAVAEEYYRVITKILGVEINLSKSVVSEGGLLEFAKRLKTPFVEYSPISAKGLLAAFRNGLLLPQLFLDAASKGWNLFPHQILGDLSAITSYYPQGADRARSLIGLVAALGPSGPVSLPLADWIALRISPVGWRYFLVPGAAHATLWALTSLGRSTRDAAYRIATQSLYSWLSGWMIDVLNWTEVIPFPLLREKSGGEWYRGAAPGYPAWFGLLTPGFWVYTLSLIKVLMVEPKRYSTYAIREALGSGWSDIQSVMLDLLKAPEVDWGPLNEQANQPRSPIQIADLRRLILRIEKGWTPDSTLLHLSLVVVTTIQDDVECAWLARYGTQ